MDKKKCSKCGKMKDVEEFYKNKCNKDGVENRCKKCNYIQYKIRTQLRKDNNLCVKCATPTTNNYTLCNKCREKENKRYTSSYSKNKRNMYFHIKYSNNLSFRTLHSLRTRLKDGIKHNSKKGSTLNDLGCSIDYLLNHLTTNLGRPVEDDDEIDHIIPAQFLNMECYEHQRLFCYYKNLRYMNKTENITRDYEDIKNIPEVMALVFEI